MTKAMVDGSAALATSTGILTVTLKFFDNHAAGIGAICTLGFGIIYVIFQFLAHQKLTLADANKKEIKEQGEKLDTHIQESTEQFKKLGDGIDTLLSRKT